MQLWMWYFSRPYDNGFILKQDYLNSSDFNIEPQEKILFKSWTEYFWLPNPICITKNSPSSLADGKSILSLTLSLFYFPLSLPPSCFLYRDLISVRYVYVHFFRSQQVRRTLPPTRLSKRHFHFSRWKSPFHRLKHSVSGQLHLGNFENRFRF